jgi:hypothetical protein
MLALGDWCSLRGRRTSHRQRGHGRDVPGAGQAVKGLARVQVF